MEWAPRPDYEALFFPPQVLQMFESTPTPSFYFENKPDLTFWLRLLISNHDYRDDVHSVTFVVPKSQVTSPYFTIEFKKDDRNMEVALNQRAAASAIVLCKRVGLRMRALNALEKLSSMEGHTSVKEIGSPGGSPSSSSRSSNVFADIKHYGISFNSKKADIYRAIPDPPRHHRPTAHVPSTAWVQKASPLDFARDVWTGCTLRLLATIELSSAEKVVQLRQWINEIQN